MAADGTATASLFKSLLLVWDVSPDQEEPWRRFLQELSGPRHEDFDGSRQEAGIAAETVWFAPRSSGGGVAIVWLEAEDPERALHELTAELAARTPFGSWYAAQMRDLFGCGPARLARAVRGEILFGWRGTSGEEKQPEAEGFLGWDLKGGQGCERGQTASIADREVEEPGRRIEQTRANPKDTR